MLITVTFIEAVNLYMPNWLESQKGQQTEKYEVLIINDCFAGWQQMSTRHVQLKTLKNLFFS